MFCKDRNSNFVTVVVATVLIGCTQVSNPAPPSADEMLRHKVEAAVRTQLRDPDSAKFAKDMHLVVEADAAMGEVNARNGFGGYSGDEGFVYVNGEAAMESDTGKYDRISKEFRLATGNDSIRLARHTLETYKSLPPGPLRDKEVARAERNLAKLEADAK